MTKTVRRLSGLEIDEVSLVDRPANQHGLVAITKRDEGPMLYDADGNPVDEADLQPGDYVYDEDGTEFRALSDEDVQQLEDEANAGYGPDFDEELVEGGLAEMALSKAFAVDAAGEATQLGSAVARRAKGAGKASRGKAHEYMSGARGYTNSQASRANRLGYATAGTTGRRVASGSAVAGGVSTVGYVGHRARNNQTGPGRVGKSLGQELMEELSKAASDDDRDLVISKAFEQLEESEALALEAISKADALADQAELGEYVELAKGYELPVDAADLGSILQDVSKALSPAQLDVLDRILNFAGDAFAAQSQEIGSAGYQPSPLMGQVSDYAHEVVGKSDLTPEQAVVALFETNTEAYDAYLSEQKG